MKYTIICFLIVLALPVHSCFAFPPVPGNRTPSTTPAIPVSESAPVRETNPSAPVYRESRLSGQGRNIFDAGGGPEATGARVPNMLLASVTEMELDPENIQQEEGTGKVTIIGCDNSVWETAGMSAGQTELAGTWTGNELNRTGEWSFTFTYSGRFEAAGPDGEWNNGRYVCDGGKDPKILNLYIKESSNSKNIGQTILMIYKVDSNTLTCASSEPGANTRPGSLTPEKGNRVLVVHKKQ